VVSRWSIIRCIGPMPSDWHQKLLSTDTHAAKCFQGHWKEVMDPAKQTVRDRLLSSRSLSGTGGGGGALLEVGISLL